MKFNDLPEYCIAEVLSKIKTRSHRNDARSVCRFWRFWINRDSSSECYVINRKTTKHRNRLSQPKFTNFIAQFMNFDRWKISFRFKGVNLYDTEDFWTEKGIYVIGISFEKDCTYVPLKHVLSQCVRLQEICLDCRTIIIYDALRSLAAERFLNIAMNFFTITYSYDKITKEMAIQLVTLISALFPRMKKLTIQNLEEFNGQHEELSTRFIPLNYALELSSDQCRVVFNSSPTTPICIRKVSTHTWTMLPVEYYKNLEEVTYSNPTRAFRLSEMENIFSQYPKLRVLHIRGLVFLCDSTTSVENQLKELYFASRNYRKFTLSGGFLNTFQFLQKLQIYNLSHASFADIIISMPYLEDLVVKNLITVTEEECAINPERDVIIHEHLKELKMPPVLLTRTRTIYRFKNLSKMITHRNEREEFVEQNVDELLQRFQCPNLEDLSFEIDECMTTSKSIDKLWLKNVMRMFPKLRKFAFHLYGSDDLISEDQELGLCEICPKLSVRDRRMPGNVIYRILSL